MYSLPINQRVVLHLSIALLLIFLRLLVLCGVLLSPCTASARAQSSNAEPLLKYSNTLRLTDYCPVATRQPKKWA
jgi:hypothetical protein